jgi:biotin synthase
MVAHPITTIADAIMESPVGVLDQATACRLVALSEAHPVTFLMSGGKIRERYLGKRVFTCAIINAKSGLCSQDCAFCAQSAHHDTGVETYPLKSSAAMARRARELKFAGASRFSIVTSGIVLTEAEVVTVCRTAEIIRREVGLEVCASLGMLTPDLARRLADSGITRYHHNLETARSFFPKICTSHDYEEDLETVRIAKKAGMAVCAGGILGLGESWEQRVELAFTLKALEVDSVPLNFLNPIPGTRLAGRSRLKSMEALRCIALFRFILPEQEILICGGREVTLKDFQSWIFLAGASGLMVGNYLTTKGRKVAEDIEMIEELGLRPAVAPIPFDQSLMKGVDPPCMPTPSTPPSA